MSQSTSSPMTKHEQIIRYIEQLPIGSQLSVRQIAKELAVSDGTAYRAIKEARELGLLVTRERIGTVRVEKNNRDGVQNLTFADVAGIVDGQVLAGSKGLGKALHKFVIGAMTQEAMMPYIDAGSLLIVGNRDEAHHVALQHGAGVLITGGFAASEPIKALADRYELPLISSNHDTFTVASMINRAMYDRLIIKKMMLVRDVANLQSDIHVLKATDTVEDWRKLAEQTGQQRFAVVDDWHRVIGMVTPTDVREATDEQTLDKLMTRNPMTIRMSASIATAAHMMIWEGIDALPIVDHHRKLIGMIHRSDVLSVMQYMNSHPQNGETIEEIIWEGFVAENGDKGQLIFRGKVTPQMTSHIGTASEGVLTTLMTKAAYHMIRQHKKANFVLDNMTTYYMRPIPIEGEIFIRPHMIEVSRKFAKVSVEVTHGRQVVCQALLTIQMIGHL